MYIKYIVYIRTQITITIMTLIDLKNNKEQIVTILTEKVGAENVKAVMTEMVNGLSCCDTL